jgi:hypothetical protein
MAEIIDIKDFEEKVKEGIKGKKDKKEPKKDKISKKLRMMIQKPIQPIQQQNINNSEIQQYMNQQNPVPEIKLGTKKLLIKGLSMPCKDKRDILEKKLISSEYINKYLDHHLYLGYIDTLNAHYKFAMVYSYHFLETLLT